MDKDKTKPTSTSASTSLFIIGNPEYLGFVKSGDRPSWWESRWFSAVDMTERMIFRCEDVKELYTDWFQNIYKRTVGYEWFECFIGCCTCTGVEKEDVNKIFEKEGPNGLKKAYGEDVFKYLIPITGSDSRVWWDRMLDMYIEYEVKKQEKKSKISGIILEMQQELNRF